MNTEYYQELLEEDSISNCIEVAKTAIKLAADEDFPALKIHHLLHTLNVRLEQWRHINPNNHVNFCFPSLGSVYDIHTHQNTNVVDTSLPFKRFYVSRKNPILEGEGQLVVGDDTRYSLLSMHLGRRVIEGRDVRPILLAHEYDKNDHMWVVSSLGKYYMPKFGSLQQT